MAETKRSSNIKRFNDPEWDKAFQKDKEDYRAEIRISDGNYIVQFRYSKEGKGYDYANTEKVFTSLSAAMAKIKSFFALEENEKE